MDPLRISGILVTTLIHGAIVGAVAVLGADAAAERPPLAEMVTIEASLAFKSEKSTTNQPQRRTRRAKPPPPMAKPNKIARDVQTAPEPKPTPTPTAPTPAAATPSEAESQSEDFTDDFERYRKLRQQGDEDEAVDESLPIGDNPTRPGDTFDGSEHGFAEVNKGHPYMRALAGDANRFWSIPTLEQGSGTAVGCVQLGADGRVEETRAEPSQNATVDAAVKRALKQLTELRDAGDKPVPDDLKDKLPEWICFKFPY